MLIVSLGSFLEMGIIWNLLGLVLIFHCFSKLLMWSMAFLTNSDPNVVGGCWCEIIWVISSAYAMLTVWWAGGGMGISLV